MDEKTYSFIAIIIFALIKIILCQGKFVCNGNDWGNVMPTHLLGKVWVAKKANNIFIIVKV